MPTSGLQVAPWVIHLVYEVAPKRVLDVGPGWGKYATLLREYVPTVERVDAIEAWEPYIEDHRLANLYDSVFAGDVMLTDPHVFAAYDLVLLVDVIEHLSKGDGLNLLSRIPGRVVICTPKTFFQNPEAETIWTEMHRSLWSLADFGERVEANASGYVGGVHLVRLQPLPPTG